MARWNTVITTALSLALAAAVATLAFAVPVYAQSNGSSSSTGVVAGVQGGPGPRLRAAEFTRLDCGRGQRLALRTRPVRLRQDAVRPDLERRPDLPVWRVEIGERCGDDHVRPR